MLLDENLGLVEDAAYPVLIGYNGTGREVTSDDDVISSPPSPCLDPARHTDDSPGPSATADFHEQAWQRLISRAVPRDELPSLIETIFSDRKATEAVDRLQGSDTQAFIDVIDRV